MRKTFSFFVKILVAIVISTGFGCSGSQSGSSSGSGGPALDVSPVSPRGARGTVVKLSSTIVDSEGKKQDVSSLATWSSSNPAVVSVSSGGWAVCLDEGEAVVTATYEGQVDERKMTVTDAKVESIEVVGGNIAAVRTKNPFRARALLSDGTVQDITESVNWSVEPVFKGAASNTPGSRGSVLFLGPGSVEVRASFSPAAADPVTGSTDVTVSNASLASIEVTPTNSSIAGGTSEQLQATGIFSDGTRQNLTNQVTWSSGSPGVGGVSNAAGSQGVASGFSPGTTAITAEMAGVTGGTSLTVTDATLQGLQVTPNGQGIGVGTDLGMSATGIFSNGTRQDLTGQVRWSSSAANVAGVSNGTGTAGTVTGTGGGNATITASRGGVSGSTGLGVTASPLSEIQVTPGGTSMAAGTRRPFTATGVYADGTRQNLTSQVTWQSGDTGTARVSNAAGTAGQVLGTGAGTTGVSATLGGVTGGTPVNVTDAALSRIDITPGNATTAQGVPRGLTATGVFSDGTRQDLTSQVTWGTVDRAVAAVSNAAGSTGIAAPLSAGSTTVSATMPGAGGGGANVTGTTPLTVTGATLTGMEVAPLQTTLPAGISQQLRATGLFSDGTTQDLTPFATWQTGNPAVAAASNTGTAPPAGGIAVAAAGRGAQRQPVLPGRGGVGTPGSIMATGAGTTPVTASFGGVTGQGSVTGSPATLTGLEVTPFGSQFAAGTRTQFNATGIFSDLTRRDLTNQVTWTSSNPAVAAISNAAGTEGSAFGAGTGTATITARRGGIIASAGP